MSRAERRARGASDAPKKSSGGSKGKTTGYVTLFEIKKNDAGEEYFQFVKNADYVNIEVNGVNVNGKFIYLNDPADKFDRMVDKGTMTEEIADEKIANIPEYVLEEATIKFD